jgi:pimeloyl-ACP methyl ester carboxylesterase
MAAQALSISRSLDEQIANGMHNAVVCTEDIPFITVAARSDPAIERSYLRNTFIETLDAMCSVWPRGMIDDDFHAPLQSDKPVLLLSGENDPVTPAAYGSQAAKHFTRAKHLIFSGQGHGQLTSACGVSVIRRFIEAGSGDQLATECLANVQPTPFVVDANGPTP